MIIVPIKEGDNIERALKRYKKKFEAQEDGKSHLRAGTSSGRRAINIGSKELPALIF